MNAEAPGGPGNAIHVISILCLTATATYGSLLNRTLRQAAHFSPQVLSTKLLMSIPVSVHRLRPIAFERSNIDCMIGFLFLT